MYSSMLVPIDGSEHAREALAVATRLASPGALVHLLHVPELPPAGDEIGDAVGAGAVDVSPGKTEQAAYNLLQKAAQDFQQTGIAFQPVVVWGRPAQMIVEQAQQLGVDAIVMGSRGLSDLEGLVLGGVSHKVLHAASCHVVVVR